LDFGWNSQLLVVVSFSVGEGKDNRLRVKMVHPGANMEGCGLSPESCHEHSPLGGLFCFGVLRD